MAEAPAAPASLIADLDAADVDALASGLRGEVLRPGDGGYDDARLVFNTMHDKRPGLIAKASGTADVVDLVRFASASDVLLSVRAGGHNVAMNALVDGGLVIDLTEMNGVRVDPVARIAYVEGGATWGDVDRETQLYALGTPGGIVSTTGVGGLTLGGGIGWLRGKHGMSCDALRATEVVTASGEVVHASATKNEDLFWALRGGGGNFGVVTAFEFELYDVGPMLQAAVVAYPLEQAPEIYRAWREWVKTVPDEVTTEAVIWTIPTEPPVMPPSIAGKDVILTVAFYSGDLAAGERVLQPVREFGTPLEDLSGPWPYREQVQAAFDPFLSGMGEHIAYWKSTYTNELTDEVIDVLVERGRNRPDPWTIIVVPAFTGAVARVGADETAFGARPPFMISVDGLWHDASQNAANVQWVRDFYDELQPHSTGQVYVNFLGEEDDAAAALATTQSVYGANYERLVDVKTKYDPGNLFHSNQNIRPR